MNLLEQLKERGVSVSFCARLMDMSKRTLQDHLDVPARLTELEEKQLKVVIRNHDGLVDKISKIK